MGKQSQTILLNQKNVVEGSNNSKYEYMFKYPTQFENQEVALVSLAMYYSWYNINAQLYNNNLLQYKWIDGTVHDVIFDNGKYQLTDIVKFIKYVMKANKHYVTTDAAGNDMLFYFDLIENPPYYCFQFLMDPLPSLAQTRSAVDVPILFKAPDATWNFPSTPKTFQFLFPTTSNFNKLLGFNYGYTPNIPTSNAWTPNSDFTPVITPCNALVLRCNLVNNALSVPNDVIYTFTQGMTQFGDLIEKMPTNLVFSPVANGTYPSISITFMDQNYQPVQILDSQLLITLLIQDK